MNSISLTLTPKPEVEEKIKKRFHSIQQADKMTSKFTKFIEEGMITSRLYLVDLNVFENR